MDKEEPFKETRLSGFPVSEAMLAREGELREFTESVEDENLKEFRSGW